jgi:SAM-dependent methyltransferase
MTSYVGSELELFANARNWKAYLELALRPYLLGSVLEVGAGLGGTTAALCRQSDSPWVCLEPDPSMCETIRGSIAKRSLPERCSVRSGTIDAINASERFDAILYVDVLEHLHNDRVEVERAARHLSHGGKLIVVAPAHQWLFSPFDASIGHFRRYDRGSLRALFDGRFECNRLVYLDAVGLLASAGNRVFLRQGMPTSRQLAVWDRLMVPLSRLVDPVLGYSVGKTVLGIWGLKGASLRP